MKTLIKAKDISFGYDSEVKAIGEISFEAREGEAIGLIGANGAGKSTLLKLLVGLESGYKGELYIEDIPVKKETLSEVRSKIGYVFQDSDSQLFMTTVGEDVAFAPRNYGLKSDEVERRTQRALNQVHIAHLKNKSVYRLSGGEKKLASIATILSMDPSIILMDEPTVALDPRNRRNLIRIINELPAMKIIASHDLDFIWDTCPRTILIGKGKIVADGKTSDILTDRKLLEDNELELPLSMTHIVTHTHDGSTHTHRFSDVDAEVDLS